MSVIDSPNRFVLIGVINYQLLIRATDNANCRRNLRVVEGEGRDMLGSWMCKGLKKLVQTSLLQPLNIILYLIVDRQLKLIEIELVS